MPESKTATYTYADWEGGYGSYSNCHHWRTVVPLEHCNGTLVASASFDKPKTTPDEWAPYPDLGIYLAFTWLGTLGGVASAGVANPVKPWWPFVYVEWPDQGTVSKGYYKALVDTIVEHLDAGETVEVACAGGHGRTGTLLAGVMASINHTDADTTIKHLRKVYCNQAIETYGQEDMVYTLLGETPPVKREWKPKTTTYSSVERQCVCGHSDWWHGEVNTKSYKEGPCDHGKFNSGSTDCQCSKFVLAIVSAVTSPDCTCSHTKNWHGAPNSESYGIGKCYVTHCDCSSYLAKGQLLLVPPGKPCICGHSKTKHRGSQRNCRICGDACASGYVQDDLASITNATWVKGQPVLIDTTNTIVPKTVDVVNIVNWQRSGPTTTLTCTIDTWAGEKCGRPALYETAWHAICWTHAAQYNVRITGDQHPAVCLCGHLQPSHSLVMDDADSPECRFCQCNEFIDSDNVEDGQSLAYTWPKRYPSARKAMEDLLADDNTPDVTKEAVQRYLDTTTNK